MSSNGISNARRTAVGRVPTRCLPCLESPRSPEAKLQVSIVSQASPLSQVSFVSQASQSTLPEVIENLGTGLFQVQTSLLTGPVWFADGAELILISSVADAVAQEWDFNPAQKGLVVTFVFLGVLCGNLASGALGDSLGRRLPILLSFFGIFAFSACSALAWGFWSLSVFRLLVGFSIGIGQPAQQALVSEVTPTKWRVLFSSAGMYLFSVGEIYSGCLLLADDPQMKDVHWRTLLIAGAVPSVIAGLLAFTFLNQSPLFLALAGRHEETQAVLQLIRRQNSASDVSLDFKLSKAAREGGGARLQFRSGLGIVFGSDHLVTTFVLVASLFALNLAYNGSTYAFPNVLIHGVSVGGSPAAALVFGALMELAGVTAGVACILYLNRITVMKASVVAMALALGSFAVGAPHEVGGFYAFLRMFGYYGTKFFVEVGYVVFYLYASEVYPTAVRTTGTSVTFAGGRLAAMLSPLVFELMTSAFGTYTTFFWVMATACFLVFFLLRLLTVETYGQVLNDAEDEEEDEEDAEVGAMEARLMTCGSTV